MEEPLGVEIASKQIGMIVIIGIMIIIFRHSKSRNKLRLEKARKVYDYLISHPCIDCGERDPIVLEFDHKDGRDKTLAVCLLVTRSCSWARIYAEIQTCEVRRANCHRRKTASNMGYKRLAFAREKI